MRKPRSNLCFAQATDPTVGHGDGRISSVRTRRGGGGGGGAGWVTPARTTLACDRRKNDFSGTRVKPAAWCGRSRERSPIAGTAAGTSRFNSGSEGARVSARPVALHPAFPAPSPASISMRDLKADTGVWWTSTRPRRRCASSVNRVDRFRVEGQQVSELFDRNLDPGSTRSRVRLMLDSRCAGNHNGGIVRECRTRTEQTLHRDRRQRTERGM
jgi:hypothetical protein